MSPTNSELFLYASKKLFKPASDLSPRLEARLPRECHNKTRILQNSKRLSGICWAAGWKMNFRRPTLIEKRAFLRRTNQGEICRYSSSRVDISRWPRPIKGSNQSKVKFRTISSKMKTSLEEICFFRNLLLVLLPGLFSLYQTTNCSTFS